MYLLAISSPLSNVGILAVKQLSHSLCVVLKEEGHSAWHVKVVSLAERRNLV